MVVRLGDLLRHTLALADEPEITLRRELEILRSYLEIETIRFGDRLLVSIDVPDSLLDLCVPSLLLQPLVENAVRHGVAPRAEPGRVTIRAHRRDCALVIEVEDDGPGFRARAGSVPRDFGVGLTTTNERLAVRYGARASVRYDGGESGGALVTVELPITDG